MAASMYGLITRGSKKAIPPDTVRVKLTICDTVASVESTMVYTNNTEQTLDSEFLFPVDDDSAVYQFEVDIDGRRIIAECQDKQLAKATHREAKQRGYSSFYLGEVDHVGDIFRMSVANLPSHKPVTIRLSYVMGLKLDNNGAVNFVLPIVLNPRYTPLADVGCSNEEIGTALFTRKGFAFEATVAGQLEIVDVTSQSDGIEWEKNDSGHVAARLSKEFKFESDLNLRVLYNQKQKTSMVLAKGDPTKDGLLKKDVLMMSFFPNIDAKVLQTESEFIFFVDRSYSMEGRIKHANQTLWWFLKSLPIGSYFNIISFGDHYELLFPASREYNSESLEEAINIEMDKGADMGGTELLPPLRHMYRNMKPVGGRPQQVFVLTDGEIYNTRKVIDIVEQHNSTTRVFAFGIGDGVSTALVKGLARAGKGKAEFVCEIGQLHSKVLSCVELAMQSSVSDLKVQCNSSESGNIVTIPDPLPCLFAREHLVLYGIVENNFTAPVSVSLTGKIGGVPFNETLTCSDDIHQTNDLLIHRIASKTQIKLLENSAREAMSSEIRKNITVLSSATNIVSMYTSFVGVDIASQEILCNSESRGNGYSSCESDEELWDSPRRSMLSDSNSPSSLSDTEMRSSSEDSYRSRSRVRNRRSRSREMLRNRKSRSRLRNRDSRSRSRESLSRSRSRDRDNQSVDRDNLSTSRNRCGQSRSRVRNSRPRSRGRDSQSRSRDSYSPTRSNYSRSMSGDRVSRSRSRDSDNQSRLRVRDSRSRSRRRFRNRYSRSRSRVSQSRSRSRDSYRSRLRVRNSQTRSGEMLGNRKSRSRLRNRDSRSRSRESLSRSRSRDSDSLLRSRSRDNQSMDRDDRSTSRNRCGQFSQSRLRDIDSRSRSRDRDSRSRSRDRSTSRNRCSQLRVRNKDSHSSEKDNMLMPTGSKVRKKKYEISELFDKQDTLSSIIYLQYFTGSWELNSELAKALSCTLELIQSISPVQDLNTWATALVMAWLHHECADQESTWKLIYIKAETWLGQQNIDPFQKVQGLVDFANEALLEYSGKEVSTESMAKVDV